MSSLPDCAGDSAEHIAKERARDEAEELLITSSEKQSAISDFPPDLLSLIFQYAYPVPLFDGRYRYPDTDILRSLSLVSKHWHRTLMATPEIWTSICISMEDDDTSAYAAGLASFLGKTSHRLLTVTLNYGGLFDVNPNTLLHPSVDPTILKNLERIENLQLVRPPPGWFYHLNQLKRINHFSLYLTHEDPPHICFQDIPWLSKFTLVNGDIRLTVTNASCAVTSLTLILVPLNTCFNIVAHCPQLTMLHLEDYPTSGQQRLDGRIPDKPFEAQQLEILVWKLFNTRSFVASWQIALLKCIGASSLQTLVWHQPPSWTLREWPEGQQLQGAINTLFSKLSPALTRLEFVENVQNGWWHESSLMGRFNNSHNIDSLKFSGCNVPFIAAILEDFASPSQFPKLRTITIGKIMWSDRRRPELDSESFERILSGSVLQTLELRLTKAGAEGLALYLEDDSPFREEDSSNYRWLDRIKSNVVELKKLCGDRIEIYIASKPVDWL